MTPLTHKPKLEQVDPPRSPRETLPTMYDLPSEDPEEPGLPDVGASPSRDVFHDLQPQLLSHTLRLSDYTRDNCFTASDLNLYYDINHPLWHKRPDWFLSVGVPRLYDGHDLRRSYVVWQEGRNPYVVIEFLSPGTERDDLGRFYDETSAVTAAAAPVTDPAPNGSPPTKTSPPGKLEVYEQYLRVPHYLVYSRYTQRLRYFKLDGGHYQEQSLNSANPIVWLADLKIGLGIWQGEFEGVPSNWLRWCDEAGNWLLTDVEEANQQAAQERLSREQERLAKEQAQAQLLQAARNLLATGMNAGQVSQLLNLSVEQIKALQQVKDD